MQDAGGADSMDTDDDARAVAAAKKEERDTLRREQHVPRRCVERWASLVGRAGWTARKQHADATFTAWMRSRMSPQRDAQRKLQRLGWHAWLRHRGLLWRLRCLLWRAWTHRWLVASKSTPIPANNLGRFSCRDAYIYNKCCAMTPELIRHGIISSYDTDPVDEEEDAELQEAISRSLTDHTARNPGGRTASTRKLHEAGIPATPGSARARKKRGGKRS